MAYVAERKFHAFTFEAYTTLALEPKAVDDAGLFEEFCCVREDGRYHYGFLTRAERDTFCRRYPDMVNKRLSNCFKGGHV